MTPHSLQSVPVPDRYISRLRQSGKSQRLSLRAIQISCTLFHPLACPCLSFHFGCLFHFSSSYTYLFPLSLPLQVPASVFYLFLTLFNFPLSISLSPDHSSHFQVLHPSPSPPSSFSPLYPCEIGHFLSRVCSISGTEGVCVCVWLHVAQPCVSWSHLTVGSIQNNIQQQGNFISHSVVQGSTLIDTHFPSLVSLSHYVFSYALTHLHTS